MQPSVIICSFNYASSIPDAVASVHRACQEYQNCQVIIVDDGSTDNTVAVVRQLSGQYPLTLVEQPNAGKAAATRKGIEYATGDIIFTLDADDWFLPGKISRTLEIFKKYPDVVHVASPAKIVWQDESRPPVAEPIPASFLGWPLNGKDLLKQFYNNNMLFGGGSTFAARASVLKKMQWDKAIDMYTDEWLVMNVLLQGDSYFHPTPLSVWNIHEKNYSGKGGEAQALKNDRLRKSSACILQLLETGDYPDWLRKAYALKHAVRSMAWKEQERTKKWKDRLQFLRTQLLSGDYSLHQLWKYRAFNRLFK